MSHSPAEITQQLMVDLSLASLPSANSGWIVFCSHSPDFPNDSIVVYDVSGTVHGRAMSTGRVFEHFGLSVIVRSEHYGEGYRKAKEISKLFAHSVKRNVVVVDGENYLVHSISRTSGIMSLGIDSDTRRNEFSLDFLINVRSYLGD